jgi:acyl-coenzyme A synthetase/AMP-(fatty) acid ligase
MKQLCHFVLRETTIHGDKMAGLFYPTSLKLTIQGHPMVIDFMRKIFRENQDKDAIVWKENVYRYDWLSERIEHWQSVIESEDIKPGTVTIIEADFSPNAVALFLTLIDHGCVLVPLTSSVQAKREEFIEIAQGEISFGMDENDHVEVVKLPHLATHEHYQTLRRLQHPGLVLFSSGSTGKSKAAVHDFMGLLEKFKVRRHSLRAITFLLYDHIGGVNTMLYTLSNAGCIVTVQDRSPDAVLSAIEKYKVELLPTSPTFVNLILLSEAYKRYDTSTLKTITYGTEPMPENTLRRIHEVLPLVNLLQTYGLSELGILRSKSKDSGSLWVKVGGEDFQTKVVDGTLWILARSAMMGYLNAASPFDAEGWMNTEDMVEVDGDYIRILGRSTDIINVGGQKVYPAEVESVLMQMDNIQDVTVYGEKNPITGHIVAARVNLFESQDLSELKKQIRAFCKDKLASYKIPVKVEITGQQQFSSRYKKLRKGNC